MKYFARFISGVQPKNKAQKTAFELMSNYASTLIDDGSLNEFIIKMHLEIDLVNTVNPRCSDIRFESAIHDDFRGKFVYIGENLCSFQFHPVKSIFKL